MDSVCFGGLAPIPTACSFSRGSLHKVSRARFYFHAGKQARFANKPLPTTADHTLFGERGGGAHLESWCRKSATQKKQAFYCPGPVRDFNYLLFAAMSGKPRERKFMVERWKTVANTTLAGSRRAAENLEQDNCMCVWERTSGGRRHDPFFRGHTAQCLTPYCGLAVQGARE